jgi:hypothetical protein
MVCTKLDVSFFMHLRFIVLGTVHWTGDSSYLDETWNTYAPLIVPDFTQDGVPELIVAHGGDPSFLPQVYINYKY